MLTWDGELYPPTLQERSQCVPTHSVRGELGNGREGEMHPLPRPCLQCGEREDPNGREENRRVSLARLKPWQRSSPCALADAGGCVWKAEPSSRHDALAARVADPYWSCQQRPREVALPYLFLRGTRVFRALPAGQRLHATKRPSQEAFEPQPLRQKHRAAAGVKSQPRAPHHDGQLWRPHAGVLEKQHAEALLQAGCLGVLPGGVHGSPPTPKGRGLRHAACPQPPPSWHREESRRPQPELSSTAACDLACFYSEERLKDGRYENSQAERLVLPFAWCVSSRRAVGEVGSPCWCRWLPPCGAERQGPPKALDVTKDAHYRLCMAYRERAVRAWQGRSTAMFPFCVHTRVLTLSHTQIL